jgi:hypothetical protein
MQERAATLIGRNIFTEAKWNSFSREEQDKFRAIFGMGAGWKNSKGEIVGNAADRLKKELAYLPEAERQAIIDKLNGYATDKGSVPLADAAFYRKLELGNIQNRIARIKSKGNLSSAEQDQVDSLEKAALIINGQDMTNANFYKARKDIDDKTKDVKDLLRTETDANKKAELKRKLKELNADSRELNTMKFWTGVGTWEGRWGSFKNLVIEGNLLPSIYNGDFFDSNKNDFAPSDEKKYMGLPFLSPRQNSRIKLVRKKESVLGIGGTPYDNKLYYLTPRSMMKQFFSMDRELVPVDFNLVKLTTNC